MVVVRGVGVGSRVLVLVDYHQASLESIIAAIHQGALACQVAERKERRRGEGRGGEGRRGEERRGEERLVLMDVTGHPAQPREGAAPYSEHLTEAHLRRRACH